MTVNRNSILNVIKEYLSDAYEVPVYRLTEETNLRTDLNMDSLCYAELAYELTHRMLLSIETADLINVNTIKDLVDMCQDKAIQDMKIHNDHDIFTNRVYK